MHFIRGVFRLSEQAAGPRDPDAQKFRRATGPHTHKFCRKVRILQRCSAIESNARNAENPQRRFKRLRRINEQIVSQFQCGLIELAARGGRPARRDDGHFGIVHENVARFVGPRCHGGKRAISFARIRSALTVQKEGVFRFPAKNLRFAPPIFPEHEVTDVWFALEDGFPESFNQWSNQRNRIASVSMTASGPKSVVPIRSPQGM